MPIVLRGALPVLLLFGRWGRAPTRTRGARQQNRKILAGPGENTEEWRTEAIRDTPRATDNRRESQIADGGVG